MKTIMKKSMTWMLASLPVLLMACAPAQSSPKTQPETQPVVSAQMPEQAKGIWIDVRSAQEYQAGHLGNAVNVPHTEIANQIAALEPNKDAPIHLYCHSGRRAEVALNELKKLGYTNVHNHGAYTDLLKQGLK